MYMTLYPATPVGRGDVQDTLPGDTGISEESFRQRPVVGFGTCVTNGQIVTFVYYNCRFHMTPYDPRTFLFLLQSAGPTADPARAGPTEK